MERINKYIASCGICSRRKADELIQDGKVIVNGTIITDLGIKVSENDKILIDDKEIRKEENKKYIMLNKPKGYVTTSKDQFDRRSVLELIHENERVYPIGRLDMYTEGLLLLTNDGEFANRMMHPKNEIEKVYVVTVKNKVSQEQLEKFRNGVDIGDYITRPAKARVINGNQLEISIKEGKNRQVRRMCESVGIELTNLKRIQIGKLKLNDLRTGKYIVLKEDEIKSI